MPERHRAATQAGTVTHLETQVMPKALATLPQPQRAVVARLAPLFAEAGEQLHLVGGVVRDLLLARPIVDLDFATSAVPETTRRLGERAGAVVYDPGLRFGTIGLVFERPEAPPIHAEITTYRAEHYPDQSRFPTVQFGASLVDDLARRDFTINAMAIDTVTGETTDPFSGEADLHLAVIRAVGAPDERFAEDPLRLLRAARFVAQLGFRLDPDTEAAMARNAPSLTRISQERILAELTRLLTGEWAPDGLDALRRTGLLTEAMPELEPLARGSEPDRGGRVHREKDLWAHTVRVVGRAPKRPVVRWAALLHDAAKPLTRSVDERGEVHFFGHERVGAELATRLLQRLKADKATQQTVARLVELHGRPTGYEGEWTDSAVRRLQVDAGDVLDDLLDLAAADVTSAREHKQRAAAARIDTLRAHIDRLEAEVALAKLQSPLDGNELMAMFGRPPGIWIKHVKERLRELVLDGELAPDDKETAAAIARDFIASQGDTATDA